MTVGGLASERDKTMTYMDHYHSPLGDITIAGSGGEITGLWFDGQKYFGARFPERVKKRRCLYLKKQEDGLTFILAAKLRILRRRLRWRRLLSAKPYGRSC